MILIDTAIWIDHLRSPEPIVSTLLDRNDVLIHPFIVGELSVDSFKNREAILSDLRDLPRATVANDDEVLTFVTKNTLYGIGIGYIDAHLLASVQLTAGALLWTRDKRLHVAANRLGLAMIWQGSRPH